MNINIYKFSIKYDFRRPLIIHIVLDRHETMSIEQFWKLWKNKKSMGRLMRKGLQISTLILQFLFFLFQFA